MFRKFHEWPPKKFRLEEDLIEGVEAVVLTYLLVHISRAGILYSCMG